MKPPLHSDPVAPERWKSVWRLLQHLGESLRRGLAWLWVVQPEVQVMVQLNPEALLRQLARAAKPSTERLHLREVFASGRRYQLSTTRQGELWMQTTSKVAWHPRRRTSASATLIGKCETLSPETTRLSLHTHLRWQSLLESLLVPSFMASLLVFMAWEHVIIIGLIVLLYGLSWLTYRNTAALEAQEMLFFVDKALEDYFSLPSLELGEGAHLIYDHAREFQTAWARFYEQMAQAPQND